eukprot:Awhi_evm1s13728
MLARGEPKATKKGVNSVNKNTPESSIGIYFYAGSSLNGFIDVFLKELPENVDDPLIKVTLTGYYLEYKYIRVVSTEAEDKRATRNVDKTNEGILVREKTKLSCPPLHVFPPNTEGLYRIRYPVTYRLKRELTESFTIERFDNSTDSKLCPYVRYDLAVEIKYNGIKKIRSKAKKRPLHIMGRRPTHDEMIREVETIKKEDKKGKLQITARTDAHCYLPGQIMNIECKLKNDTGKEIQIANLELQSKWTYPEGRKADGKDDDDRIRFKTGDMDTSQTKWHASEISIESCIIRAMEIPDEDQCNIKLSIKIPETLEIHSTELDTKFGMWLVEHQVLVRILYGSMHNLPTVVPVTIMPNPKTYNSSPSVAYPPEYCARLAHHIPFQGYENVPTTVKKATPVWNYIEPTCFRIELLKGIGIPRMDTF